MSKTVLRDGFAVPGYLTLILPKVLQEFPEKAGIPGKTSEKLEFFGKKHVGIQESSKGEETSPFDRS